MNTKACLFLRRSTTIHFDLPTDIVPWYDRVSYRYAIYTKGPQRYQIPRTNKIRPQSIKKIQKSNGILQM